MFHIPIQWFTIILGVIFGGIAWIKTVFLKKENKELTQTVNDQNVQIKTIEAQTKINIQHEQAKKEINTLNSKQKDPFQIIEEDA